MTHPCGRLLTVAMLLAAVAAIGARQQTQSTDDPRVGLKPGFTDAGQAAKNMALVASMPKPPGFDDPGGTGGLNFANSDMAFKGPHLFIGNFAGFTFYNIEDPRKPQLTVSVPCPGGQGDLSVYGNLLFMSVEQTRGRIDCGSQGVIQTASKLRFRGVRIFDITDITKPKQVAAVQTCRGSHTHTLVTNPKDKDKIYVYGSGTSGVRPEDELEGCSGGDPSRDPNTALFSIDVIEVLLKQPEQAHIVSRPRIFADPTTGAISGLWPGGAHGAGTQQTSVTNQCHDITTFPAIGLAAGACAGNGILLDIRDPVNPKRLDAVVDPNFAYWHSATFNNDGTKVLFTDEWGGGTSPRCRSTDLLTWGADAIFDVVDGHLKFGGYYKMPAAQTEQENCVAHNGSLIPVPGRDIKAQAWYQGGVSVFDFTESSNAYEIAYFDRGPLDASRIITAGYWSTYWYNGYIYGSEIARGLDIFKLTPSEFLSQNELDAAMLVKFDEFNAQEQPTFVWPNEFVVARAYLDQLARRKALPTDRVAALNAAMDRAETQTGAQRRGALDELEPLVSQLEKDAGAATPRNARTMRAAVAVMREKSRSLR
ncbi:MAG TPA: hypothetical protein VFV98_10330 [Vicinamibacterales bacterium]|nr:hypothetical protein [Vicinamibacterales bacterium]